MDPTTPTSANKSKCRSTHSLVPSPVRNRRELTFGSASRDGYGIVSAAGLNAWRRGAKRNRTPSVSAGVSGSGRLGLGMGLEGTPGRKKFKRFSKSSKVNQTYRSDHDIVADGIVAQYRISINTKDGSVQIDP